MDAWIYLGILETSFSGASAWDGQGFEHRAFKLLLIAAETVVPDRPTKFLLFRRLSVNTSCWEGCSYPLVPCRSFLLTPPSFPTPAHGQNDTPPGRNGPCVDSAYKIPLSSSLPFSISPFLFFIPLLSSAGKLGGWSLAG